MSLMLWISLILTYYPVAVSVHGLPTDISQKGCLSLLPPSGVIWTETGKSASIRCNVDLQCKEGTPDVLWFVFDAKRSHHELRMSPGSSYTLQAEILTIHSLSPDDSGYYLCAVRSKSTPLQVVMGTVTILVVRGKVMHKVWHSLLWLLFTLLAIYNLILIILIFRKKAGPHRNSSIGKCESPKKSSSTTRVQFRSVVEELYNRRNLHGKGSDDGSGEEPPGKVTWVYADSHLANFYYGDHGTHPLSRLLNFGIQ
ncbi:uncharacterized protein LOC115558816 isoform X1 [Gadus morhua]|uniref:uncharacterized protein LOC115558816 isoform X1 n=1 Tax=Gadus morhua TaxID=8049 RepID=UPI0011B3E0D8|nr:uncharacterized protein LOC115558816 isoform X1 [Gadus morhua]